MTGKNKYLELVKMVILFLLLLVYISPFIIVLINSFKSNADILRNPLAISQSPTFENFATAYDEMNFMNSFFNTVLITVFGVALIILASSMSAYFLARVHTRFSSVIFMIMVVAMVIPFQAVMIPLVSIYGSLGILNSRGMLVYMYVGFGCSLAVFIFQSFIKTSVPISIEEASEIDGCNKLQTFFIVVFPLLKPTIATVTVLDMLWIWNDYLLPSLVLTRENQLTLPLSTYAFYGSFSVDYGPLMASLVLTIIPILILYLFLQDKIISGVVSGAVKT
ncbi:MAG: carbohydrate ABC transporter permease [Clostridiales bacterium]|jgi:raffinose/stachyose/melibiose transport system permease protein|nr:carbohydrate ABC transporter permease [Clostridiales bacterium]